MYTTPFGNWADRYWDVGLKVFPLKPNRTPLFEGWQTYELGPDDAEKYCQYGVGIECGERSGIVAIDIDKDDAVDIARAVLPKSPCAKFGKKGITWFYKYIEPIEFRSLGSGEEHVLDIIRTGNYTVLPPSIHPETGNPYVWLEGYESLLDCYNELPPITASDIDVLRKTIEVAFSINGDTLLKRSSGRNTTLFNVVSAMTGRHEGVVTITRELMKIDASFDRSYFEDKSEKWRQHTPLERAYCFVLQSQLGLFKKKKTGESVELPVELLYDHGQISDEAFKLLVADPPKENSAKYPYPNSPLGDLAAQIGKCNFKEQPAFALSAAIMIYAALAANKFHLQGVYTNILALNIGPTGSGKDMPQNGVKTILERLGRRDLLGPASIGSDRAYFYKVETFPQRIDIWDEIGPMLKEMSNPSANSFHRSTAAVITAMWSMPGKHYTGHFTNKDGLKGACFSPCLSLMGSTTATDFFESVSPEDFEKGLLSRFLYFFGESAPNHVRFPDDLMDIPLSGYIQGLASLPYPDKSKVWSVELGAGVDDALYAIASQKISLTNPIMAALQTRMIQHVKKLALINALSRQHLSPIVEIGDVDWAMNIVKSMMSRCLSRCHTNMMPSISNKMYQEIAATGKSGITAANLHDKFSRLRASQRKEILSDLIDVGYVALRVDKNLETGKITNRYFALAVGGPWRENSY